MKLIKRHIKTFERFIQNPPDPNKSKDPEITGNTHKKGGKKEDHPELPQDDEDLVEDPKVEKDIIDKLNEYFNRQKLK